ncbi:hypothetical protein [Lacticaseibacillus saniviri]|uniref:Uncharacterized protein n=1 Tax=Lacticaseibacillus saniviri JCM 17471 = DSM 24301 TaxID=1293598 RepID=A0A0R2MUT9_9LACO|nr:hypothetical protein [Lacticaseibacillus saniviri]KRO17286.1 hypothetical protein IV56_GL000406 [Lacticaseibacillus saniviri JCM 17471 = DSM 24301]MCG4282419.1 hypothetical protein [Lacticaseibacillus saniviri]
MRQYYATIQRFSIVLALLIALVTSYLNYPKTAALFIVVALVGVIDVFWLRGTK